MRYERQEVHRHNRGEVMLELIGFIALVYLAIKFFPDIIVFAFKTMIVLVGLWLLFGAVIWAFGVPVVLYEFRF